MVRLAIKNDPELGSIMLGQQRFTAVDTLPVLHRRFKGTQLYMLMGDDWLSHFADWPHVDELIRDMRFVIGRQTYSASEVDRRLDTIQKVRGLTLHYQVFPVVSPEFSSSAIRQQIKQGRAPEGLSLEVLHYIREHGLYVAVGSSSKS
jgi:nicotinic acid mononucleotide adenylyltransferase